METKGILSWMKAEYGNFLMPEPTLVFAAIFAAIVVTTYQYFQSNKNKEKTEREVILEKYFLSPTADGKPKIYKVGKNVYVAASYGPANATLIEGEHSCVLINCGNEEGAKMLKSAVAHVTDKPVMTVIITRDLEDLTGGLNGISDENFRIYAHEDINLKQKFIPVCSINTITKLSTCGLNLVIYPCGSESPEQIYIWYPDERILFTSGSYCEKPRQWQTSSEFEKTVGKMIQLNPRALISPWSRPMFGEDLANDALIVLKQNCKID